MTIEEFAQIVKRHDLTYEYSDDNYYYRQGQASYDAIVEAARHLPREDVVRIWNAEVDRKLNGDIHRIGFYWKV